MEALKLLWGFLYGTFGLAGLIVISLLVLGILWITLGHGASYTHVHGTTITDGLVTKTIDVDHRWTGKSEHRIDPADLTHAALTQLEDSAGQGAKRLSSIDHYRLPKRVSRREVEEILNGEEVD